MSPWKCSSAMNIQQDTSSSLDQQRFLWNSWQGASLSNQWTHEILLRETRFSLASLSNSSTSTSTFHWTSIEVTLRWRSETFPKNSPNRSLFSPGSESFLVSLRHEDASSVIEQRFDQFSRSGRGKADCWSDGHGLWSEHLPGGSRPLPDVLLSSIRLIETERLATRNHYLGTPSNGIRSLLFFFFILSSTRDRRV